MYGARTRVQLLSIEGLYLADAVLAQLYPVDPLNCIALCE